MILRSLFISNFRRIKILIGILAGVILFCAICRILTFLYVEEDQWSRKLWHDFYELEENIDYLYLGSSHVYHAVNPAILDEKNGKMNFNLSTPSQNLEQSYYVLREADKYNDLSRVYVELAYVVSTEPYGNFAGKDAVINTWRNTDYMKWSLNKIRALADMSGTEYLMDALFPFLRYRTELTNMDYVRKEVGIKRGEMYRNYEESVTIQDENAQAAGEFYSIYYPKGFYYTTVEFKDSDIFQTHTAENMSMTEDAKEYLGKIIEYCRDKGIEVVLFCAPVYELNLIAAGQYDSYRQQVQEIAQVYGIEYYDFNIARKEVLPIQQKEYFFDDNHLNSVGAELFTNCFHRVMTASAEERKDFFYASYEEKLQDAEPNLYGIYYRFADPGSISLPEEGVQREYLDTFLEEGRNIYSVHIASNKEEELEYRVVLTPKEEKQVVWQDFSSDTVFYVPSGWCGECTIIWRRIGQDEVSTLEMYLAFP